MIIIATYVSAIADPFEELKFQWSLAKWLKREKRDKRQAIKEKDQ